MLGTISAKVTATPGGSGWAQVHEFSPDDPEKLRLRGRLFAVLATKRVEEGIDTIASGRELIGRLHEEYFGNTEGKPFDALQNASRKVANEFTQNWGDVEIAACALVNGVVYSSAFGGSRVVISRQGALATILESTKEVVTASGYPKNGDVMLLATKAFFEKVTPGVIKAALTGGSPETAAETFMPIIHAGEDAGTVGAAIIRFEEVAAPVPMSEEVVSKGPAKTFPEGNIADIIPAVSTKAKNLFAKLVRLIPKKNIYIKPQVDSEVASHEKKLTFSVGVILLIILIVSIGFGIRQKKVNDTKKKYQGILAEAQLDVDQAISLASASPDKSRELFTASEQKLEEILSLKIKDPKVTDLQNKINESRSAILGEYEASPELFLDLGLLSSGFNGDEMSFSGGNIFILDKAGSRIVSVATETKKSKVVAGPTLINDVNDLASYEDTPYVLLSDGIYELGGTKTKVIDKTWPGGALISAFAGNLYVLSKDGNAIYRYPGETGGTFGVQHSWLVSSAKVNFTDASSWGMDGAIYVLYPNSRILKFSLGSPQNFSVKGVTPEIGKIDAIFADSDNQYLYLLDKAGKRVVVIDKNGSYKAQYINDQIAEAKRLVVSEAQKEIILLTGGKLLSIEIKHL